MYAPHGKWAGFEHTRCACGALAPDRAHWGWECKWCNGGKQITNRIKPIEEGERRLCVPLVERPWRGWKGKNWNPIPDLRKAVREEIRRKGRAIIATDGGAEGASWQERVGVFGVAVGNFDHGATLRGLDQTPYAAELWALYKTMVSITGLTDEI